MVAYHFPPFHGSSGIQRTLRFARYLPEFGWEPIILTAHPRAYAQTSPAQLGDIPDGIRVVRAQAWDASRHLSIGGRYPSLLARPDRWLTWWLGAVPAGLKLIRRFSPDAIWSTYPIATAHVIGATLHARSKLPWVADFRDPMAQDGYPEDPAIWRSFAKIEARALKGAAVSTFTTPSALADYQGRYSSCRDRMHLLENGYDEETFSTAHANGPINPGKLTLLHSGIVYSSERDPSHLFEAIALLKATRPDLYDRLIVRFRASVHETMLAELATRHGIESAIQLAPSTAYREALSEMLSADGLLILQASNCNAQIPAKLYEYMRSRRPIVALTDPAGDTAVTCRAAGISAISPLDDAQEISSLLARFCNHSVEFSLASESSIGNASRRGRTEALASLLNVACSHAC